MKYLLCLSFVAVVSTLITGCATERQIQVVDRIQRDTIYINKVQYDSIYIDRWQKVYQQSDTVYLKSTMYEYRYKLLRDTVYSKHPIPIAIHQSPSVYWGFRDIRIFCLIVFLI